MKQHWKIGVIYIFICCFASIASDIETGRFCEPIKIPMCQNLGYNMTKMPNLIGHELQSDVELTLQTFTPLIQYGCSSQLNFFLCSAYLPMCSVKVNRVIPPCRKLCETVRARCSPVLSSFGFQWPQSLDCNRFPKENNAGSMCMDPPIDIRDTGTAPIPSSNKVKLSQPACQYLQKSNLYVRLNRSNRCVPLCEADIVFDSNEKHMAEMWVFSWSMAALLLALLATLCLILSNSRWDKKLMPLVICHFVSNMSWAIRILAGRNATSCSYDPQLPGISLLLSDGLSTSPCSGIFLLRYYFGMAAPIWVAILSYGWNQRVKHHIKEAYGSAAVKHDTKHNTMFQILSFGIPAVLTVITLISRFVDADELLGTCFVGNQNDKALLFLVALPLLIFWMISCGYLLSGYLRSKSLNLPAQITGLGTFLFIYNIPSALNICTMFYLFGSRESWITSYDNATQKAPLWPFILQPFVELLIGVLTSSWAIGPRIIHLCRSNVKQPPPSKQPLPAVKYQPSPYNSTSYQTICPPNSSVSMTSIGTINKAPFHKHARIYSNRVFESHSSLPRKGPRSSSYRMASVHSGNETVF